MGSRSPRYDRGRTKSVIVDGRLCLTITKEVDNTVSSCLTVVRCFTSRRRGSTLFSPCLEYYSTPLNSLVTTMIRSHESDSFLLHMSY